MLQQLPSQGSATWSKLISLIVVVETLHNYVSIQLVNMKTCVTALPSLRGFDVYVGIAKGFGRKAFGEESLRSLCSPRCCTYQSMCIVLLKRLDCKFPFLDRCRQYTGRPPHKFWVVTTWVRVPSFCLCKA